MEKIRKLYIGVDFDGTLVKNRREDGRTFYPGIGPIIPMAFIVIKRWVRIGHPLMLHTARPITSESRRENPVYCTIKDAWDMVRSKGDRDWPFDTVNENHPDLIQLFGSDVRKLTCQVMIDDACVLWAGQDVDWIKADTIVQQLERMTNLDDQVRQGARHGR